MFKRKGQLIIVTKFTQEVEVYNTNHTLVRLMILLDGQIMGDWRIVDDKYKEAKLTMCWVTREMTYSGKREKMLVMLKGLGEAAMLAQDVSLLECLIDPQLSLPLGISKLIYNKKKEKEESPVIGELPNAPVTYFTN